MAPTKNVIIKTVIDHICHDPYAYNPNWKWDWLPSYVKESYDLIRPTLLLWQTKGYITLIENETSIFTVHPEKLPSKKELLSLIV